MKKAFVIGIVLIVLIVLCSLALAAQPVLKYWQDVLRKPNQTWQSQYGPNMPEVANLILAVQDFADAMAKNDSDLAFNVRSLLEVQNRIAQEVVALQAKVEAHDPNGLHIQLCKECGRVSPFDLLFCSGHDPNGPNEVKE